MIRGLILPSSSAILLIAQQPAISNADLRQASAAIGLDPAIASAVGAVKGPLWIGYAVPTIPGDNNSCCWNDYGRGCGLEGQHRMEGNVANPTPVRLEGPSHVVILMRFEPGAPDKLRVFSPDCPSTPAACPSTGCPA